MSSAAPCFIPSPPRGARLEVLFDQLAELAGQRNAIDGRIVDIVAEIDRDGLWSTTGAKTVAALVAWKLGTSPHNAETLVTVAERVETFPRCLDALREGRFSLDQVGVIAERAADGSDDHYALLTESATVSQLRIAAKAEPRPEPKPPPEPEADSEFDCEPEPQPPPEPERSISKTSDDTHTTYRIRLPHAEAATVDAALASHLDGLVADWKHHHDTGESVSEQAPPFPSTIDAFMSVIEAGWDTEVARRPHGQRTTAVIHVDADSHVAALHLGPLLSEDDRRFLLCDATCEVWFQRHGQVIGAGRATRTVNRRLRRALEHRDRCCVVPGCGATRGLHAHHLRHWEDGGLTELCNLALVCPYHHRAHHRGLITITGPADRLVVTDHTGQPLTNRSLARPPTTPPPAVAPYAGPTGERAQWKWYHPYQPQPPPATDKAS
ncbi:HNH endonuclease signature motif containing protein [Mycolicibacterium hippocampi]|uniref:HNH endonuclease domain protein n=1 Tax=Mycolicibacterium hippocampi TaxID=659824 RepID=A0A850PHQ4_9MYCO|nr:HNH endonuclease signature motif containing protein [Mycolicibacterium hippocampi]NVN49898.1 HNH endonuclease domain protein [Mycolicibacterium hippocampi]